MSTMQSRPAHADDLDAARAWAFAQWARGVADRRSPFHTPTLATIGRDGAPRLRTLVLRGFDSTNRILRMHTDRRAEKFAEIGREPRVSAMGYDPGQRVQIRLEGHASLHTDDALGDAGWAASRDFSRMCYAINPGPGQPVGAPLPAPLDPEAGRPHFAVVQMEFHRMEWLWLAAEGHRRARFTWGETDSAAWLVP